jgi:GntR family transcriptional regulator
MWIEETVDRESQQKLYVQLYGIIKGKIEKNEWPLGTLIPSEDELCKIFNVSKATVRLAVSDLVRSGYLRRQQGKGTFVTFSLPHTGMTVKTWLTEDVFGENLRVTREVLSKGVREPSEEIKGYLKAGGVVYYVLCKGAVADEPVYLEELYVPLSVFPGIETEDICHSSFYELIQEKATKKISKVLQIVEVTELTAGVGNALSMREGESALLLHRILVSPEGSPLVYQKVVGNGRKYKFQSEFERIKQ